MAAASSEPQETECAVCTNDFTTPKILPCGHLLCRECVVSWLDSKLDSGCPLCRCPITESENHLGLNSSQSHESLSSKIADALPTDFVTEALVDSALALAREHICCVCDEVKAESICIQCLDMLCLSCTKAHKKLSATRIHNVESLSTMTPERLAASRPALCAEFCGSQAHFFCYQHALAICASCCLQNHKQCPDIVELEDGMNFAEFELSSLIDKVERMEGSLEEAIAQLVGRIQELQASERDAREKVNKACERLHELVEECRKDLQEMIQDSHASVIRSVRDDKETLSENLGRVTSHKRLTARAKAILPCPALIYAVSVLENRVNSLDLSPDLLRDVKVNPSLTVSKCEDVVRRMEKELQQLNS